MASADYKNFWDPSTSIKIKFSFTKDSLVALSHYGAADNQKWGDVYFPADMEIQLGSAKISYDEVGVRMKGNTSRTDFMNSDGTFNGVCHLKVSFKATFDDSAYYDLAQFSAFKHDWTSDPAGRSARKNRNLYGMEKIDLKYLPRNNNGTYSQEMYCYDRFNAAGILAPYAKWSEVTLDDVVAFRTSSYEIIEDIDKSFLKNRLGKVSAQGDLYKCVWGSKLNGSWAGANLARTDTVTISTDANGYDNGTRIAYGRIGVEDNFIGYHPNYQLKTNDDGENSDFSKMANYINVAHSCRYNNAPLSLLENTLDIDEFLRFEAAAYLFGNFDDQRMNYNNYYLYFRPSDGKAIYIPYDWDWSLGNYGGHDTSTLRPFYNTALDGGQITTNIYYDTFIADTNAPVYDLTSMKNKYLSYISSYINQGFLDGAKYASFVSSLALSFSNDVSSVQSYMNTKRANVLSYL